MQGILYLQLPAAITRCAPSSPTLKSGGACVPPEYMAPAPVVWINTPTYILQSDEENKLIFCSYSSMYSR